MKQENEHVEAQTLTPSQTHHPQSRKRLKKIVRDDSDDDGADDGAGSEVEPKVGDGSLCPKE